MSKLRNFAIAVALTCAGMLGLPPAVSAQSPMTADELAAMRDDSLALLERDDSEQARIVARRALAGATSAFGPEHIEVAETLMVVAMTEPDDAPRRVRATEAADMAERILGPRDGRLARYLVNKAMLFGLGADTDATIERALRIAQDAYGESHQEVKRAARAKFMALSVQARFDEANAVSRLYGLEQ